MRTQTTELTETMLRMIDFADIEAEPRPYSGRVMYGKQCVGITVAVYDLFSLGARLEKARDELGIDDDIWVLMGDYCTDNMGKNIVIYWPDLEWPSK